MAKKFRYRVILAAEEESHGFVTLTKKEAEIVAYATNDLNWENASIAMWSGNFRIDLDNPIPVDE